MGLKEIAHMDLWVAYNNLFRLQPAYISQCKCQVNALAIALGYSSSIVLSSIHEEEIGLTWGLIFFLDPYNSG